MTTGTGHKMMSKANGRQSLRHKPRYNAYRLGERREHNKARRLAKHLTKAPGDLCACKAFQKLPVHCIRPYREALSL